MLYKVSKKRKTSSSSSSNTQTTLDSFRRAVGSPLKVSRESKTPESNNAVPMNVDHDSTATGATTMNATLGSFRRQSQPNKVIIKNFKG